MYPKAISVFAAAVVTSAAVLALLMNRKTRPFSFEQGGERGRGGVLLYTFFFHQSFPYKGCVDEVGIISLRHLMCTPSSKFHSLRYIRSQVCAWRIREIFLVYISFHEKRHFVFIATYSWVGISARRFAQTLTPSPFYHRLPSPPVSIHPSIFLLRTRGCSRFELQGRPSFEAKSLFSASTCL